MKKDLIFVMGKVDCKNGQMKFAASKMITGQVETIETFIDKRGNEKLLDRKVFNNWETAEAYADTLSVCKYMEWEVF